MMTANDNDWSFLSDTAVRVERIAVASVPDADEYHITVTECPDGSSYGNGVGLIDGEEALYISSTESDVSLTDGLKAAVQWAETHKVTVIYIQPESQGSDA